MSKSYLLFGALLLGGAGVADFNGYTLFGPTRVDNVPKSIRDNPGAYRSHYSYLPRYVGGK